MNVSWVQKTKYYTILPVCDSENKNKNIPIQGRKRSSVTKAEEVGHRGSVENKSGSRKQSEENTVLMDNTMTSVSEVTVPVCGMFVK